MKRTNDPRETAQDRALKKLAKKKGKTYIPGLKNLKTGFFELNALEAEKYFGHTGGPVIISITDF